MEFSIPAEVTKKKKLDSDAMEKWGAKKKRIDEDIELLTNSGLPSNKGSDCGLITFKL